MRRHIPISLRWGDIDAYGHINNVAVVRLLEEARARALWKDPASGVGLLPPLVPGEPLWSVVSEMTVRYLRPLNYSHADVTVVVEVAAVAGASFTVEYEVRSGGQTGELHATASTTIVMIDAESGAPRRLAADLREALRSDEHDP